MYFLKACFCPVWDHDFVTVFRQRPRNSLILCVLLAQDTQGRFRGKLSYKLLSSCSPGLGSEPKSLQTRSLGKRANYRGLPWESDEKKAFESWGHFTRKAQKGLGTVQPFPLGSELSASTFPRTLSLMAGFSECTVFVVMHH